MEQFWVLLILFFGIGWIAVSKYEKETRTHDHRSVVIDEVLGMFLIFAIGFDSCFELALILKKFIEAPTYILTFAIAFIVFRYFDIRKPLFIGHVDKLMRSSFSVILDDLLAGLFSYFAIFIINSILQLIF